MARIWVWRLAILRIEAGRGAEAGACREVKWEAMLVIARRTMEGLLEWGVEESDSEMERETLRMISPEGVRGSDMGGMMRCVECSCSGCISVLSGGWCGTARSYSGAVKRVVECRTTKGVKRAT